MNYKMMPAKEDEFDGINNNNNDSSSVDNNNVNMTTNTNNNNNINSYCSNIGNDSINNNNSNNSNDNFNGNTSSSSSKNQNSNNGMSKAELRKSNKPIMEKRRRARINHCLNELKTLILEAMKKDPARHTKLEKADILEMTVKHLQSIQRQQLSLAMQTDPTVIHKFKSGFSECAEEVNRYISQLDGIEPSVQQRLSNHLNNCATGLEQLGTFSNFSNVYRPTNSTLTAPYNVASPVFPLPQDINNNGRIQMGGVQLIPSRLPSGEIALIMPNTNNVPFFLPNIQSHTFDTFSNTFSRMSAFSKPTPTSSTVSGGCSVTGGIGNGRSNTNTVVTQTMTTTTTPPLSPVSSVSSVGDDSMQTSSDFQTKTPPPQILMNQSFSGIFPTPPSAENSTKFISRTGTGHLQQPLVSSTSETQTCTKSESELESAGSKTATMITPIRKRRSSSDSYSIDEPCNKLYRRESSFMDSNGNSTTKSTKTTATATVAGTVDNSLTGEGSNDNMWRPW